MRLKQQIVRDQVIKLPNGPMGRLQSVQTYRVEWIDPEEGKYEIVNGRKRRVRRDWNVRLAA